MNKNNDILFGKMARIYADNLGQTLKAENVQMPITPDTTSLDQKVHAGIGQIKKQAKVINFQKYAKIFIPVAACLVIILAVGRWNDIGEMTEAPALESSEASLNREEAQAELIPLSYPLPENLSIANQKLDNGMTVYELQDVYHDDVVMQLVQVESIDYEVEGMQEILVNGKPVYATVEDYYQKITFEKDGIVYILTCKYDINTLLPICEKIL